MLLSYAPKLPPTSAGVSFARLVQPHRKATPTKVV